MTKSERHNKILDIVKNNHVETQEDLTKLLCECGFEEEDMLFPTNPMLAQSYVPFQYMDQTFKPCVGLRNGTIFPELVSPYSPGQSMEEIAFIEKTNKIGEGCNSCQ